MITEQTFTAWNLEPAINKGLEDLGWENATWIQLESIPSAREGKNLIGQARTGSGKTGAFGIPILEQCEAIGKLQALVLTPTRELASQVCEEFKQLQSDKGLKIISVYGGTDIDKQAKELDDGVDIIVGTPGRVMDMSKRGHIDLSQPSIFTLDEADRMLDMGFMPDIMWIMEKLENRQQTLLFSATFPPEILDAANEFMPEHVYVSSGGFELDIPDIEQHAVRIGRGNKLWVMGRILTQEREGKTIIFCNTKRMVDMLVERLAKHRFSSAVGLHGDLPQNKRERILNEFRQGEVEIIVATDVAARGLDVQEVTCVINYDLPDDLDSYVHRIGRTGRIGRKGEAWSFITKDDVPTLNKLRASLGLNINDSEAPELVEGVREPVQRVDDWSEVADVFGMVPLTLQLSGKISKLAIIEHAMSLVRMQELALGDIRTKDGITTLEVHSSKVSYVKEALDGSEINGVNITVSL
jgi:ATP-dependent RNA helicase DeaD